jgi:hypothetical protein
MNGKFTYERKEVEQIVLDHHKKSFVAPDGYIWEATERFNNVEVELIKIKEEE